MYVLTYVVSLCMRSGSCLERWGFMSSEQYAKIPAKLDSHVLLRVVSGHFATSQSHITRYLDIMAMKSRCNEARGAAHLLSHWYESSIPVDSIVCMEGMEVIGTYLAEELTRVGVLSYNAHKSLYVIAPEFHSSGQVKNILVLTSSVTTGKTLSATFDSIRYYQGTVTGACAVFSTRDEVKGIPIHAIFQPEDVPGYEYYKPEECPYCKQRQPIDAIVNDYGYSSLR